MYIYRNQYLLPFFKQTHNINFNMSLYDCHLGLQVFLEFSESVCTKKPSSYLPFLQYHLDMPYAK